MHEKGLDQDGFIEREGSLALVSEAFAPVVATAKTALLSAFAPDRLHSAYLYGSVPRGTAVPGTSDLDLLLALRDEPTDDDRATARRLEDELDARFPQINGAGILLYSAGTLLSDIERHDLGWFVACLCTPLAGEDLAVRLPRYRPTSLLARETNGDLCDLLPRWRDRLGEAQTEASLRALARGVGRRLVRTGFTLVMPRFGGWTSNLEESAAVFGRYYPARADPMKTAAAVGRVPAADPSVLAMLIGDLGPWLAAEYVSVHGRKTPRSDATSIGGRAARGTSSRMDVIGCLGCDLLTGRRDLPGGVIHETASWMVNHVVGPMSLGTLIVGPRDHVTAVADLDDRAAAELGPVLRGTARVVQALCQPEQTYVCLWSHGAGMRKHLHFAVQPVTAELVARYGGLRSEQLQARMMACTDEPDVADVERFCQQARQVFRAIASETT
jgi:diadenosine tetraphosphate (Ap4A) HIT family hydrolase